MRPWVLAETNYGFTRQHQYEVAVVPLGATEPHNLHLPYGTDVFEAQILGEHICAAAHAQGANVVLLPTIPFGTETNLARFPLAINVQPTTLFRLLTDVIDSLVASKIRKILLLNSHGGNDLKPLLRELYGRCEAQLFLCNWYQSISDVYDTVFQEREDHAGEMETSFALAFFPDLVARHEDGSLAADEGATAPARFEAVQQGWVQITRPWHLLTTNAGSGNPHAATAEKGQRLMKILVERLAAFLTELSAAPLDSRFPFQNAP